VSLAYSSRFTFVKVGRERAACDAQRHRYGFSLLAAVKKRDAKPFLAAAYVLLYLILSKMGEVWP